MARRRKLVEATRQERRRYREAILRLTRLAHQGEAETLRATIVWVKDLERRIGAEVATAPWQVVRQQEILQSLRAIVDDMRLRLERDLTTVALDGLDRYRVGLDAWWDIVHQHAPRRTVEARLAALSANHTASLIQAVSDPILAEFSRNAATVALGLESPDAAIGRMVRQEGVGGFRAIGPFRSIRARAEAIVRTETQRMYTLADNLEYRDLAREIPGTMFYWAQFSVRNPRPSHTRAMLRSQEEPIPDGGWFNVGGHRAQYPHDPNLPASESVNCNCKRMPHFGEIDWGAVVRQEAAAIGVTTPAQRRATGSGPGAGEFGGVTDPRG